MKNTANKIQNRLSLKLIFLTIFSLTICALPGKAQGEAFSYSNNINTTTYSARKKGHLESDVKLAAQSGQEFINTATKDCVIKISAMYGSNDANMCFIRKRKRLNS